MPVMGVANPSKLQARFTSVLSPRGHDMAPGEPPMYKESSDVAPSTHLLGERWNILATTQLSIKHDQQDWWLGYDWFCSSFFLTTLAHLVFAVSLSR